MLKPQSSKLHFRGSFKKTNFSFQKIQTLNHFFKIKPQFRAELYFSTNPEAKKLKLIIKYSFFQDAKLRLFHVPYPNKERLSAEEIKEFLLKDGVNLSEVANIRYLKTKYDALKILPEDGVNLSKLQDQTLILFFEKSNRNADYLGPMFYFDPNVGFIFDTLNPPIRFKFFSAGELQIRDYQASIRSIGLKAELAVRAQTAFAFHIPFSDLYHHKVINLGRGIDIAFGWFHLTYASFQDSSGGILMGGITIGFGIGASYVSGGHLIPLKHAPFTATPTPRRVLPKKPLEPSMDLEKKKLEQPENKT